MWSVFIGGGFVKIGWVGGGVAFSCAGTLGFFSGTRLDSVTNRVDGTRELVGRGDNRNDSFLN